MFSLFKTSRRSHSQALKEHGISVFIATMPVWGNAVVAPIIESESESGPKVGVGAQMWESIVSSMQNGSLLLLSTALMGSIIYIAVGKDLPEYSKSFPSTFFHVCSIFAVSIFATLFYGALTASGDPAPRWLVIVSAVLFLFSLILSYSASVFDNERTDPAGLQAQQDKSFGNSYAAHRAARE